jgi:hypothetical protein
MSSQTSEKLIDARLTAYKDEYAVHVRVWGDLERKAQAMSAISGTFVALATALANSDALKSLPPGATVAGAVGALLLGLCAFQALRALRVREVPFASAKEANRTIDAALASGSDYAVVVNTLLSPWPGIIRGIEEANRDKARLLSVAEAALALAIGAFSLLGAARYLAWLF